MLNAKSSHITAAKEKKPLLPLVDLAGDEFEAYYQLGLLDKGNYEQSFAQLLHLFKVTGKCLDELIYSVLGHGSKYLFRNHQKLTKQLEAYAAGLDTPYHRVVFSLVLPEMLTTFSKFIPKIPKTLLGCSSFFFLDDGDPIHLRILDFPLVGSFDQYERILKTSFLNQQKVWSYGTTGFPYHSLTAVNEAGITLAIHQKFSEQVNLSGSPIFFLFNELLATCETKKDVKTFLKSQSYLTTWGIHLSFPDKTVLSADLSPKHVFFEEKNLLEEKYLYYHNLFLKPPHQNSFPSGFKNYCDLRKQSVRNLDLRNKDSLEILKLFSTRHLFDQKQKKFHGPFTSSSLQICTLNGTKQHSYFVKGDAPKNSHEGILSIDHFWQRPKIHQLSLKDSRLKQMNRAQSKKSKSYHEGLSNLAKAQNAINDKDLEHAYFYLQTATSCFKGFDDYHLVSFFFLVLRYTQIEMIEDFQDLRDKLEDIIPLLDSYFQDHAKLFINRVEIILHKNPSTLPYEASDIKNFQLKKYLNFEKKIPSYLLKKMRSLITLQINILDIFYFYNES